MKVETLYEFINYFNFKVSKFQDVDQVVVVLALMNDLRNSRFSFSLFMRPPKDLIELLT